MDVNYKLFRNSQASTPVESETGMIVKGKEYQYNDLFGYRTLTTPKMSLLIDSDNRTIIISNPSFSPSPLIGNVQQMTELLANCDSVLYLDDDDGIRGYRIVMDDLLSPEIRAVEIWFDVVTKQYRTIALDYRYDPLEGDYPAEGEGFPRLEIEFNKSSRSLKEIEELCSPEYYVRSTENGLAAADELEGYEVEDYRSGHIGE